MSQNKNYLIEPPQFLARVLKNQKCNLKGFKINVKDFRRNLQMRLRNGPSRSHSSSMFHSKCDSHINSIVQTPKGDRNKATLNTIISQLQSTAEKTIQDHNELKNEKSTIHTKNMENVRSKLQAVPSNISEIRMREYISCIERKKQEQEEQAVKFLFEKEEERLKTLSSFSRVRDKPLEYSYIKREKKSYREEEQTQRFSNSINLVKNKVFNTTSYYHKLKVKDKKSKLKRDKSQQSQNFVQNGNSFEFIKKRLQKTETEVIRSGIPEKKKKSMTIKNIQDRYIKSEKHMKMLERNDKQKQSIFDKSQFNYTQLHLAALKKEGPKPIKNRQFYLQCLKNKKI